MRVLVNGGLGRMGRLVSEVFAEDGHGVVIVDPAATKGAGQGLEQFTDINEVTGKIDLILDFSTPEGSAQVIEFAGKNRIPVLIGTTGLPEEFNERIKELSLTVPVLVAANTSIGIAILRYLIKKVVAVLPEGYDIEIIETHHRYKVDAPSGTALTIAKDIQDVTGYRIIYGRKGKREENEIGISSLRGGGIVGEHTIKLLGDMDELYIGHKALNRKVFAQGALMLGKRLVDMKAGLYSVEQLLGLKG